MSVPMLLYVVLSPCFFGKGSHWPSYHMISFPGFQSPAWSLKNEERIRITTVDFPCVLFRIVPT